MSGDEACKILNGVADILEGQADSLKAMAGLVGRALNERPSPPAQPLSLDLLACYALWHRLGERGLLINYAAAHNLSLGDLQQEMARQRTPSSSGETR